MALGTGPPLILPPFEEKFGMKGAVISAVDLIKGLGNASGMEVIDVEGATGLVDTNYEGKVEATLKFLEHGDFVYVHLEGPDESVTWAAWKIKLNPLNALIHAL